MKVNVRKLKKKEEVLIKGQEPWLSEVYKYFGDMENAERVTGSITIEPIDEHNRSQVFVSVSFSPMIPCAYCLDPIKVELSLEKEFEFKDEPDPLLEHRDVTLQTDDIEKYYLDSGNIELSDFINEIIQLEIPSRVEHNDPDHPCTQNNLNRGDEPVFRDAKDEKSNPFAALKDLKN